MNVLRSERLIRFAGNPVTTFVVIALSLAGRILQLVFFYNMRFDASYQVIATQNLLKGRGVSLGTVMPVDLATTIYEPLIKWPPGYSYLLAPFYKLFGSNYIAAGLTLDIVAAVALIFCMRAVLKVLDIPVYLRNIFTLLTSFFIYYFYFIASSDAIAISVFMIALHQALVVLKGANRQLLRLIIIFVCLFTCITIKYLFIPVAFVIPFFFLVKGWADRVPSTRNAGFYLLLSLGIALAALLLYQKSVSGSATYISEPGRGMFPNHLSTAYPFLPASFIKPETVSMASGQTVETGSQLYRVLQVIHLIAFVALILFAARTFNRQRFKKMSLAADFYWISFLIFISIPLLLGFLSITVPKEEIVKGYFWTYLEEPRYYGLANVLAQLGLFVFYYKFKHVFPRWATIGCYVLTMLLVFEMSRGIIFDSRRIILMNKEEYSWQYELRFQEYADSVIKKEMKLSPGNQIVVAGPAAYMANRISLYNDVPVLSEAFPFTDTSVLHTTAPVMLIVLMEEQDRQSYQRFIANSQTKIAGLFNGVYIYIHYASPASE